MWEGLGSALVGAVATALVTLGAVWLTLRHERRQQSDAALGAELGRLLADLRPIRRGLRELKAGMETFKAVPALLHFVDEAIQSVGPVTDAFSDGRATLYAALIFDLTQYRPESDETLRALAQLEQLLTWLLLTPDAFDRDNIGELGRLRQEGKDFPPML